VIENRYISLMGTMGSGKTTAAELLAQSLGYELTAENFAENVFLPRFYEDPPRWAFHSQTFFLMEKIRQLTQVNKLLKRQSIVQDTPVQQDVFSYAQAQHRLHNMDAAQWNLYNKIYDSFVTFLPTPNLIVYLEASLPTLMSRIHNRGRTYEQQVEESYVGLLNDLNHEWLGQNKTIPVLVIETERLDIVKNIQARGMFVAQVAGCLHQTDGRAFQRY
jgi:deoxyadenosine/deoxycytidine kinase